MKSIETDNDSNKEDPSQDQALQVEYVQVQELRIPNHKEATGNPNDATLNPNDRVISLNDPARTGSGEEHVNEINRVNTQPEDGVNRNTMKMQL